MDKGCIGCMGNEETRQYCRSCGDIKPSKKLMSWIDGYMDYIDAIEYLEESKCDQKQGEEYQERHNKVLDIAIRAIESQILNGRM